MDDFDRLLNDNVCLDEEDGWTVVTEDELPSAQWEHTFLMTEKGLEILTY